MNTRGTYLRGWGLGWVIPASESVAFHQIASRPVTNSKRSLPGAGAPGLPAQFYFSKFKTFDSHD